MDAFASLQGLTCGPAPGLEAFRPPPGLEAVAPLQGLGGLEAPPSTSTFMPKLQRGTVQVGPPGIWPPNEECEERLRRAVAHASHVLRLLGEGGGAQEPPSEVTEEGRGDMTEEQSINEEEELGVGEHGGERTAAAEDRCELAETQKKKENVDALASLQGPGQAAGGGPCKLTAEHRGELVGLSQKLDHAKALEKDGLDELPTTAASILLRLDFIAGHGDVARRAVREAEMAVRDVLLLVCSRNVMSDTLAHQGMPDILRNRILTAFNGCLKQRIFTELGTAKYHLFNEGVKFNRRPRRRSKRAEEQVP